MYSLSQIYYGLVSSEHSSDKLGLENSEYLPKHM